MIGILLKYRFSYAADQIKPKDAKRIIYKKRELYDRTVKQNQESLAKIELKKQETFKHTYNYNFEQYLKYTKMVQSLKAIQELPAQKKIKKIYDRPRFDANITDYKAWLNFHNPQCKVQDHCEPVVCKIYATPKDIINAFGFGSEAFRNRGATREFDFEDNNLDKFIVYDYRQTTQYWGANKNQAFYDKQVYLKQKFRRQPWPTPDEFWSSEEIYPFRVNCTNNADYRKFKRWFKLQLNTETNYIDKLLAKYGQSVYYDNYESEYKLDQNPTIFQYGGRQFYLFDKTIKLDESLALNSKLDLPVQLDEKYRISLEDLRRLQREDQQKKIQQDTLKLKEQEKL